MKIDFESLSENPEVVKMLKEYKKLEEKIQSLDEFALLSLELKILYNN